MSTASLPVEASGPTGFHLAASLIDPSLLPPPILTSEPGSFAQDTLRRRIPAILREAIDLNPDFDLHVRRDLDELGTELRSGRIRGLREDAPDVALWSEISSPHLGRSWLDVPWYWAEAYFYRRLLEATGYFREGRWRGFDPFGAKKRTEWAVDAAPAAVGRYWHGLLVTQRPASSSSSMPACGAIAPTSAIWLQRTWAARRTRMPSAGTCWRMTRPRRGSGCRQSDLLESPSWPTTPVPNC